MKKQTLVTLTTAIAVALILILALLGSSSTMNASSQQINQTDSALPDANAVAVTSLSGQYLTSPPYFPNSTLKTTKVFLETATLWDNSSSRGTENFPIPQNYSMFVVNGTVRNDYSTAEIIQLSKEGQPYCLISLDIYLYDEQGNFINTLSQGNPFRGCCTLTMIGGQEANFNVAFALPEEKGKNLTLEIYVSYLDPLPLY